LHAISLRSIYCSLVNLSRAGLFL